VLMMCLEGAICTRCQRRQIGLGPGEAGIMERWEEDFLHYLHFKVANRPLRSVLDESADISLYSIRLFRLADRLIRGDGSNMRE